MKKTVTRISKKLFAFCLITILCLQIVMPGFVWAGAEDAVPPEYAPTYDYMSPENAPILYGTTAIKVPVGTEVDYKHDARFRVFAKDNEDFDLTSEIEAVVKDESGAAVAEIDSAAAGRYTIEYTVTDSDDNTVSITVPVEIVDGTNDVWLQKTMYTLPSVDHLNNTGHTRGNYMDRQIIGIFLDDDNEGNVPSFEMRKISGKGNLTVPLQNNDGYCESTATVEGNYSADSDDGWQTVKNTGTTSATGSLASVPTVKTLYKETVSVVYEVKYDSTDTRIKPLHYYHEGDGFEYETRFLQEWQDDIDSFAVVDGVSMMALMPYEDRAHVYAKDQRSFDSFDEMFAFWTQVLDSYDALIGISYTPDYYWNQAVKTKYFVRANKHGAGAAYYNSGDCIGTNRSDMFSALCPWWGTLHEYGHGYQGNVGNSSYGMPITEVAVNIFSYYIQRVSGFYPYPTENWLGDIDKLEDTWNNSRKTGHEYKDNGDGIGSAACLYMLINMLKAVPDYMEAYAYINQYYREVYFTTGEKMKNQDAWILAMAEKYNINLTPYIESWGITVSDYVKDEMMLSDAEAVYFMSDMVADPALSAELKKDLDTFGDYGLVKTSDLAEKGLTGTVKITFNISDFENIRNKYLYINDGDTAIATVQVTSPEMVIELPVGVYKVAPPRGNTPMDFDRLYMTVVNNTETPYEITYQDLDTTDDGNDIRIQSVGYYGNTYIPFTVETQGDTLVITYRGTRVKADGSITVQGKDGEIKHSKSPVNAYWTTVLEEPHSIELEIGDEIIISYKGTVTDITATSLLTGEVLSDYGLDSATKTSIYVYTQYGLVPESIADDEDALYEMYKDRVNSYIESLFEAHGEEYFGNPFLNVSEVNKATELVAKLSPEDKAPYAGIFTQGSAPVITFTQDSYTYDVNTFDLKKFIEEEISITDIEENVIDVNSDEVKITSTVDAKTEGIYSVQVEVTDHEGNVTIASVTITIIDPNKPENPAEPDEGKTLTFRCKWCIKYEIRKGTALEPIYNLIHQIVHFISEIFGNGWYEYV